MIDSHLVPRWYIPDSLTLYQGDTSLTASPCTKVIQGRCTKVIQGRCTKVIQPTILNHPKPSSPRAEVNKVAAQARPAFAARAKPACSRPPNRLAPLRGAAHRGRGREGGPGRGSRFRASEPLAALMPPSGGWRRGAWPTGTPVPISGKTTMAECVRIEREKTWNPRRGTRGTLAALERGTHAIQRP